VGIFDTGPVASTRATPPDAAPTISARPGAGAAGPPGWLRLAVPPPVVCDGLVGCGRSVQVPERRADPDVQVAPCRLGGDGCSRWRPIGLVPSCDESQCDQERAGPPRPSGARFIL